MRIKYNAPTILTYALVCAIVMALTTTLVRGLAESWFSVPGKGNFSPSSLQHWVSLLSHVIGHSSWSHLVSNFALILIIGPMLEENYGSLALLTMIIITALVTGIINVLFFTTALRGASGVVFMMILLASFTNFSRGEIPLTFILVLILYLGEQINQIVTSDNNIINHFAHIAGGFCGSLFGFLKPPRLIKRRI